VRILDEERQKSSTKNDARYQRRCGKRYLKLAEPPTQQPSLYTYEVIDGAIQRLHWACRRQEGFPGTLPDQTTGAGTTNNILEGLGLIRR
jgi:hypothetical protein